MNTIALQVQLFKSLRNKLANDNSLADELAVLLDISTDSAYRRIRGEKALTFDELYLLCNHYQLSARNGLKLLVDAVTKGIIGSCHITHCVVIEIKLFTCVA